MESRMTNGASGTTVRLLSKKQMAAEMGVCYRTIERWDTSGYIRRIRIGGRVYFSYAEVVRIRDRFLDNSPDARQMDSQIRGAGDIIDRYQSRL
jgi:DNA-binding transcriptional MerR regulator